jgi:two-component sensor histidine kinase
MSTQPQARDPSGDQPDGAHAKFSEHALRLRIRQQELLAELGAIALQRVTFSTLLDNAVRVAAEGLQAEFCKVLEFQPAKDRLLLVAGVGWNAGLIGAASLGADLESPAGFALRTGKPVISNQLERDDRFRTPELLRVHGVRRAINVILQGAGTPFGVLEVDSRSPGEFSAHDVAFLQSVANILGMAIEHHRYDQQLHDALEHQKVLVDEINHRVKNSLQIVASLFRLQAATSEDPGVRESLHSALWRITAIARIHERLYRSTDVAAVDLAAYLRDICADLSALCPQCEIASLTDGAILMGTDRAVRVGLLTTELLTNAVKHAGPGRIVVKLSQSKDIDSVTLAVRDEGPGLPGGFNLAGGSTLGIKIIGALVEQLGASITAKSAQPGTEFVVDIPLDRHSQCRSKETLVAPC